MARKPRLNILRRPPLARTKRECLDCGFLGFANSEVQKAARVEFGAWISGAMSPTPGHHLELGEFSSTREGEDHRKPDMHSPPILHFRPSYPPWRPVHVLAVGIAILLKATLFFSMDISRYSDYIHNGIQ